MGNLSFTLLRDPVTIPAAPATPTRARSTPAWSHASGCLLGMKKNACVKQDSLRPLRAARLAPPAAPGHTRTRLVE